MEGTESHRFVTKKRIGRCFGGAWRSIAGKAADVGLSREELAEPGGLLRVYACFDARAGRGAGSCATARSVWAQTTAAAAIERDVDSTSAAIPPCRGSQPAGHAGAAAYAVPPKIGRCRRRCRRAHDLGPSPRPVPAADAIPRAAEPRRSPARPERTVATVLDTSLIPGRSIQPIDLPNALRLAGTRELDIAIARRRMNESIADLQYAWAQWLPSLFLGPTWYRADGQVQTVTGQVENVNRSSLFLGGVAATTAPGFAAASPGTGYVPLNGSSAVFRFSDAIYMPIAAQRVVNANRAGVHAANNDAILAVAEAYFDLQQACGLLAINREAVSNAKELSDITGSYARTGEGSRSRPPACAHGAVASPQGYAVVYRPVAGRFGQPGAAPGARPANACSRRSSRPSASSR